MSCDPSPPGASRSPDQSALALTLRALRPLLSNPDVMELCIKRPGEAFVETGSGWRREDLPFADYEWCHRLAKLIANSTQQRVDATSPLLSASLPHRREGSNCHAPGDYRRLYSHFHTATGNGGLEHR